MALTKDEFIQQTYYRMADFGLSITELSRVLNKQKIDYEEDVRTKISNIIIEHNRVTGRRITGIDLTWEETCSGDKLVANNIIAEPLSECNCQCSPQ